MAKIITLGEIMLRLSPEGQDRFIQSDHFRIIPGGGEANVAGIKDICAERIIRQIAQTYFPVKRHGKQQQKSNNIVADLFFTRCHLLSPPFPGENKSYGNRFWRKMPYTNR